LKGSITLELRLNKNAEWQKLKKLQHVRHERKTKKKLMMMIDDDDNDDDADDDKVTEFSIKQAANGMCVLVSKRDVSNEGGGDRLKFRQKPKLIENARLNVVKIFPRLKHSNDANVSRCQIVKLLKLRIVSATTVCKY